MSAVKKIIKYFSGANEFGLWYSHDPSLTLMGYNDANWASNSDDQKSTLGGCFFLANIGNGSDFPQDAFFKMPFLVPY